MSSWEQTISRRLSALRLGTIRSKILVFAVLGIGCALAFGRGEIDAFGCEPGVCTSVEHPGPLP